MLERIITRPYYLKRHINAPLLEERIKYIQYWEERGRSLYSLKKAAQYLLRIVEFLPLETNKIITIEQIEEAATRWAKYQYSHPQKRSPFCSSSKDRFTLYAVDWLRRLNRLEPLPEENVPLFSKIFERRKALQRHTSAPLLKERLMYLQYWADNGAVESSLRRIASYLLVVMNYLSFDKLRMVSPQEIEKAADCWARNEQNYKRKSEYSRYAKARFVHDASVWLDMLKCLEKPNKRNPFEELLTPYVTYMREEQGLSETTIKARSSTLQDFLLNLNLVGQNLNDITPMQVDEVLIKKHNIDGYSRRTIQFYASIVRSFLKYAENQGWCQRNLGASIKTARVYRHELLPYSPSWEDIKKMLASTKTDEQTDIRDYAILMLLSVYGMRCSEVTHLCLEDFDWNAEQLHIRRAKHSRPQTFPLSQPVGNAILNYLKRIRPNNCALREVFLCMRAPYRPLTSSAIYQLVSRRLKPLDLHIKHHGPHALRHACATHLINEGISLKEISDHLGHQGVETTRIYAKVDLTNLRKVAELELGDLL